MPTNKPTLSVGNQFDQFARLYKNAFFSQHKTNKELATRDWEKFRHYTNTEEERRYKDKMWYLVGYAVIVQNQTGGNALTERQKIISEVVTQAMDLDQVKACV
jgi:hypothetical protein